MTSYSRDEDVVVKAVVLLGAPGAGKGTLAQYLLDNYKVIHFSTGNLLRNEIKRETDVGLLVKSLIGSGALVGDDIINEIVASNLSESLSGDELILLDGYPRTLAQAKYLDEISGGIMKSVLRVIEIDVDPDVVVARIAGRKVCSSCGATFGVLDRLDCCVRCGGELISRVDDEESIVRNRLKEYAELTLPLSDYYASDRLVKVSGNDAPVDVACSVDAVFRGFGISK